jgi:DNA end-binding protein Ku
LTEPACWPTPTATRYSRPSILGINQKRRQDDPLKDRPKGENVVDLMEALRRSVDQEPAPAKSVKPAKKPRKAAAGQKEMLMPIEGKKPKQTGAKKSASRPQRKSA